MILADFFERLSHIAFVSFTGNVTVALDVLRRRHFQYPGDLRKIFCPFPIVIHTMHPIERPFGAALEECDFELGKFFEYAAEHERDQRRRAVHHPAEHMGLEEIIEAIRQLAVAIRMTEKRHTQLFRYLIIGIETWVIDVAPTDVGNQMTSLEAQLFRAA